MNKNKQLNIDDFIKAIESRDFSSKEDIELLKKLNEAVEAMLQYAQSVNKESKNN